VREGAARSINTVAVAVAEAAGRQDVIDMARLLGITTPLRAEPALALGAYEVSPLELTAAYGALSNGGRPVTPFAISKILAGDGTLLYQRAPAWPPQVIASRALAGAHDIFGASMAWGTAKRATLAPRPAVGKTGTTQDYRDAWFMGTTRQLTAGVWMGNDDNSPSDGVFGGLYPALLWKQFMTEALADAPFEPLPMPAIPDDTGDSAIEKFLLSAKKAISESDWQPADVPDLR
jgi:penicillin-binding protein 1A